MDTYTVFLLTLGTSLILSKVFSGLIEKSGIPGVLGEISVGILLGSLVIFYPVLSNYFAFSSEAFDFISKLGIVFLLFLAGLDTDIRELKATGKAATLSTIGGVITPLIIGFFAMRYMGFNDKEAFAIGVMLTATSIGLTVRVMMDLRVLNTRVGNASLSASVMDDFIGIALIIIATGKGNIFVTIIEMVVFILITLIIGWFVIDRLLGATKFFTTTKGTLAYSMGIMLLFSALAEYMFEAAIEGSFIAGLIMHKTKEYNVIINDIRGISYGFLVPLFFVHVGSILDIRVFTQTFALYTAFVVTLIAIGGKIIGRGIFAKIGGFNWRESFQMGVGSVPRMEVALISAYVAINANVFTPAHVQIVLAVAMVFVTVTTLITPPLLKASFKKEIEIMKSVYTQR